MWYCFGPLCFTFVTVCNNLCILSLIAEFSFSFFLFSFCCVHAMSSLYYYTCWVEQKAIIVWISALHRQPYVTLCAIKANSTFCPSLVLRTSVKQTIYLTITKHLLEVQCSLFLLSFCVMLPSGSL